MSREALSLLQCCGSVSLSLPPLSLLLCECVFGCRAVCACTLCIYIWAGRLLQASLSSAPLYRKTGSAAVVASTAALAAPTALFAFLPSLHLHLPFPSLLPRLLGDWSSFFFFNYYLFFYSTILVIWYFVAFFFFFFFFPPFSEKEGQKQTRTNTEK